MFIGSKHNMALNLSEHLTNEQQNALLVPFFIYLIKGLTSSD